MWRRLLSRDASRAWQVNRVAATASPSEHISMHRVRLKPSRNLFRRAVGYGATGVVCFYVWEFTAFWPVRGLDPNISEEMEKEEVEPMFIPLPFTVKQVKPPPYAGSGEEWQDFIKFNSDHERRKNVKNELRHLVKKSAEKNPIRGLLGPGNREFELGPSFLIYTYPAVPPPEYIRWGIEFNDDAIELKTQKLDARTKVLLDRVAMPYPVISGSYAFLKAMVKQNTDAVTKYFGYTPANKEITAATIDPELAKALKKLETRQATHGGPGSSPSPSSPSSPSASESDRQRSSGAVRANTAAPDRHPSKPVSKDAITIYSTLADESSGPSKAFRESLARAWKPLQCYPPRGSIGLHGIVTLDAPKGRIYIDVFAWYHPKTREFHHESMKMRLRSVSPRNQVPLRQ